MSNQPLLPSDRYLMQVLAEAGVELTEEDWRSFKAEVRRRALEGPQPAVVNGLETLAIIAIVTQVISIGLTIAASFFKPRPNGRPAELKARQSSGTTINSERRYAPRSGFDAVQEPASIGSTIPLVYARRETFNGGTYGGVRINMPLLWSNVQSYGGSQMLRAIFLVSEGAIGALDTRNFAIGNNVISSYDLLNSQANQIASRISVYFRPDGGRIRSADQILGRSAGQDQGNAENFGAADVFCTQRASGWFQDFSSTSKPSTQTTFGVFALIGNNLGFRVNPSLRPTVQASLVPKGDSGNAKVKCDTDQTAAAQRQKFSRVFSTRSGLTSGSVGSVGSQITYRLDNSSDVNTQFTTRVNPASYSLSVQVASTTGSQLSSINRDQLRDLVILGAVSINSDARTIEVQAIFNASAAISLFQSRLTEDGTFTIRYLLQFVRDDKEEDEILDVDYVVTINRYTTSSLQLSSSGSYTSPQLIDLGNGNYSLTSGSVVNNEYTLVRNTEYSFQPMDVTFAFDYLDSVPALERCGDVASAVASRQKAWDDALVVGDLYKIGSALAVCTARNPSNELFESESDFLPYTPGSGRAIEAVFTTVRAGSAALTSAADLQVDASAPTQPRRYTATNHPHVYRIALANVSTTRPCRVVEIGIRSSMGIRISGLCNFSDALTYDEINSKACKSKQGKTVKRGQTLKVDVFQSGVMSASEERYSFFRISYREAGTQGGFTALSQCFGVRCITQQNTYNAIRFRMPDERQWEFRFEPLTGWEIRNNIASGDLEILDSKLSNVRSVSSGSVMATFNGSQIARSEQNFSINSTNRASNDEIGIGFTDGTSYLDAWGKLAEAFVYEEVQSTASNPEHEIVYINEIVSNSATPNYDNLAIVGLNIRSSLEFQQFSQFSAYVTRGINSTHLFPEILLDLLTNQRYGRGDLISPEMIDLASFTASAQWCQSRGYFFDGVIVNRQNIRQWAADTAATHLLIFGEAGGKFFLKPAFPTDAVPIKALFTAGNIRDGSFKVQYLEAEERQPIQVSVRYREERATSNLSNPGLFPVEREILVRQSSVPDTAPIESIDMSDYATNPQHAIDAAKYVAAFRSLSTHGIRFETTYEGVLAALAPGDFIRVAMDVNVYEEFNNGIVTPSGALISTQPLSDGSYSVIRWNGDNSTEPRDGTISVSGGGTRATPAGIVFTIKRTSRQVTTYQVESIEPVDDGYLAIEAVHMPTDDNGVLRLAANFSSNSDWVIQR